jgi:chromosome segregation ATPase
MMQNSSNMMATAMRAREAMSEERDAAVANHERIAKQYEDLESSTTNEIKLLQHKNRYLQESLNGALEMKQSGGGGVRALTETCAALQQQLDLSRNAFHQLSTHSRGVENSNFKLVHETSSLTKQLGLEQGQHQRALAQLEADALAEREERQETDDTKKAVVKLNRMQQQQVEKVTRELKVVRGDLGTQPMQIQALKADQEKLAAYALSMEKQLVHYGRVDERLQTAERALNISRKHRQHIETALKVLYGRHVHLQERQKELLDELKLVVDERNILKVVVAEAKQRIVELEQQCAAQREQIQQLEYTLASTQAELASTREVLEAERAQVI